MAKRVVVGRYGSGSNDYGMRVSNTGSDVVSLDGSGDLQAAVATSDLIFDTSTATGGFGIYKVYSIDVAAATDTAASAPGDFDQKVTAASTTQPFGETLSFTPLTLCQKVVSSTEQETVFLCRTFTYLSPYVFPADRSWVGSAGGIMNSAGYLDPQGPDDRGWSWTTSTSNIIIKNYNTSAGITVRAALFYAEA